MTAARDRGTGSDDLTIGPPTDLDARLEQELTALWIAVTDAGGAVGFRPPADQDEHADAARGVVQMAADGGTVLLVARSVGRLVGCVCLDRNPSPVKAHWAAMRRLMVHPDEQGRGLGGALVRACHRVARDEMGLVQVHLEVRGGLGLEGFYARHGYELVGRLPGALRFEDGSVHDEVLMVHRLP